MDWAIPKNSGRSGAVERSATPPKGDGFKGNPKLGLVGKTETAGGRGAYIQSELLDGHGLPNLRFRLYGVRNRIMRREGAPSVNSGCASGRGLRLRPPGL